MRIQCTYELLINSVRRQIYLLRINLVIIKPNDNDDDDGFLCGTCKQVNAQVTFILWYS